MAERRLVLDMVHVLLGVGPGEDLSILKVKVKYKFSVTFSAAVEFWLAARSENFGFQAACRGAPRRVNAARRLSLDAG